MSMKKRLFINVVSFRTDLRDKDTGRLHDIVLCSRETSERDPLEDVYYLPHKKVLTATGFTYIKQEPWTPEEIRKHARFYGSTPRFSQQGVKSNGL